MRSCTCHPDEAPIPCQRLYAFSECKKAEQMTRGTWVWDKLTQRLIPKHEYYHNRRQEMRSDFPCPMLSSGRMDETWNPVDGKYYNNLRDYEKAIPKGNHIIEKGEEPKAPVIDQRQVEQTVADSWDQMESGYKGD